MAIRCCGVAIHRLSYFERHKRHIERLVMQEKLILPLDLLFQQAYIYRNTVLPKVTNALPGYLWRRILHCDHNTRYRQLSKHLAAGRRFTVMGAWLQRNINSRPIQKSRISHRFYGICFGMSLPVAFVVALPDLTAI